MRALVIDDSKAIRMILSRQLKDLGFEVDTAANGQEGLEKMHSGLSLVLVDWNMPVLSGYGFLEGARKNDEWKDVQIVMVTTETEVDRVIMALEAGANEYVMKPFDKEIIREKLSILGLAA
jgi:two-component system, chemotaxis family, chemotaxis protein CheY